MIELLEPVYWWADRLAPTLTVAPISPLDEKGWRVAFGDTDDPFIVTANEAIEIGQALLALGTMANAENQEGARDAS